MSRPPWFGCLLVGPAAVAASAPLLVATPGRVAVDTFIIIAAILRGFETFKVVVLRQLAYFFGQQSDTPEVISIKLRHKILCL